MSAVRALCLVGSAVVALLAYPAGAQVIGQETAIMGGEAGFFRPSGGGGGGSTVTIDALPYERTVSCDTYTVTGTFTGTAPTGWTADPSGDSGACTDTGGGTFECVVDVDPDSVGDGVETITIGTETVEIGFYVAGSHSCFLAQNVDGGYNSTLSDLDAVATWVNVGSSALDVTQGTPAAQPTFRTGIVGGQPVVRCDGGDRVAASTAADWTFLSNGSASTIDLVSYSTTTGDGIIIADSTSAAASRGFGIWYRATNKTSYWTSDGAALIISFAGGANGSVVSQAFNQFLTTVDDAASPDMTQYLNGTSAFTATATGAFSASAPAAGITLCASSSGLVRLTGDLFRVLIYESALTSTQRGINEAVDEWALGGTLPVTPPTFHVDASYLASVTTASSTVSAWRSTGGITVDAVVGGAQTPDHTGTGSTAQVDFNGTDDALATPSGAAFSSSSTSWHAIAVVTPGAVTSNDATCYRNNTVIHDAGPYRSIYFRNAAGVISVGAFSWDGSADCAETTYTGGVGVMAVVDASQSGGNVSIGLNGGALTSTATGANSTFPTSTTLGGSGSGGVTAYDGAIHEVYWFPAALSSGDRTALIDSLKAKWSIP
jgi:hypothetical protein